MKNATQVVGMTAGALLLLGLGAGIGSAGQRTVTVEKTPASCIEMLSLSTQAINLNTEMIILAAEGIEATGNQDSKALGKISDKMTTLKAQYDPLAGRMSPLEADCRSK